MELLQSLTTDELLDELCARSLAITIALLPSVVAPNEGPQLSFLLRGDTLLCAGLVQAVDTAQRQRMIAWLEE